MTLLFQKNIFHGNFTTFLEVSKLLITHYFLNVTSKVQITKKCLQLKQGTVYQFASICDDVADQALLRNNA